MSEVLNAEVTSSEEAGFSRRRVVKGVAWSVPVIVTAIAAPAAAASPVPTTLSIAFAEAVPNTISIAKDKGSGLVRTGQGPSKLIVQNASGTVSGTISIAATGSVDGRAWVGVKNLTNGTLGTASLGAAHTSTISYTLTGSQSAEHPITFYYVDDTKPGPVAGDITFTVTVTVDGSTARAIYPNLVMKVV